MKREHITAFYLETLLLIAVFVSIILVLTHIFGGSFAQSGAARQLTDAVCLAENAAEAVSAADSPETLLALLDESGNAAVLGGAAEYTVRACYDDAMAPAAGGAMQVDVTWSERGDLAESTITVRRSGGEAIYTLDTAVCLREVRP